MKQINLVELIGALALGAFGIFFMIGALNYRLGTLDQMGPGFFPLVVGICITSLAAVLLVTGIRKAPDTLLPRPDLRSMLLTVAALLAFALLVRPFGIVPAVLALVLTSLAARRDTTLVQGLLIAGGLALLAYLLFIVGLGLNLAAFRWGI